YCSSVLGPYITKLFKEVSGLLNLQEAKEAAAIVQDWSLYGRLDNRGHFLQSWFFLPQLLR
ncbi:hypothetical protein L7F22_027345, partial [Adiantum nelumboides]|nr:hypothetical protein [Adiantum nelumboides]